MAPLLAVLQMPRSASGIMAEKAHSLVGLITELGDLALGFLLVGLVHAEHVMQLRCTSGK